MNRTLELWVMVFKVDEMKAGRSLTMDEIVDLETRHPIMIGNIIPVGRLEQPRFRKHGNRHRAAKGARRRAGRKR